MTSEREALEKAGIVTCGVKSVKCTGNSCSVVKLKVTAGYPDPPKARVKKTSDKDVRVKNSWVNMLGIGWTEHEIWAGETDDIDVPQQYWGVGEYIANYV